MKLDMRQGESKCVSEYVFSTMESCCVSAPSSLSSAFERYRTPVILQKRKMTAKPAKSDHTVHSLDYELERIHQSGIFQSELWCTMSRSISKSCVHC